MFSAVARINVQYSYHARPSDPPVCFPPAGIPIDGKTVFTSDHALKLDWIPQWIAIIGSGYIGLEFSDVYTALGSDVTFIEACLRPSSARSPIAAQSGFAEHPPSATEPCSASSRRRSAGDAVVAFSCGLPS